MKHYVGLDVSMKKTAVCIVNEQGKIIQEFEEKTEPHVLAGLRRTCGTRQLLMVHLPLIRQKLVELLRIVSHEPPHHIFEIIAGIDSQPSACLHERQDHRCSLPSIRTSKKDPVFSPYRQRPYRPFRNVVIQTSKSILCIIFQIRDQAAKISQRFP